MNYTELYYSDITRVKKLIEIAQNRYDHLAVEYFKSKTEEQWCDFISLNLLSCLYMIQATKENTIDIIFEDQTTDTLIDTRVIKEQLGEYSDDIFDVYGDWSTHEWLHLGESFKGIYLSIIDCTLEYGDDYRCYDRYYIVNSMIELAPIMENVFNKNKDKIIQKFCKMYDIEKSEDCIIRILEEEN